MAEDYNSYSFRNKSIDRFRVQQDTVKKPAYVPGRVTPEQRAAAKLKREEIIHKKDSILDRQAAAKGMTREQQRDQQKRDARKENVGLDGMQGPNFKTNGYCGKDKAAQKEAKSDWSKK